jgi:hypothetical protein
MLALVGYLVWHLPDTRLGRAMRAVRDNELAAGVAGIDVFRTKIYAGLEELQRDLDAYETAIAHVDGDGRVGDELHGDEGNARGPPGRERPSARRRK